MDQDYRGNKQKKEGKPSGSCSTAACEEGRRGTWAMGTPIPPQTHPVNKQQQQQQTATWVAAEAITSSSDPATSKVNYMNNSSSSSSDPGSTNNPYVHTAPVPGSSGKRPTGMIFNVLNRWGNKFEGATRKAENVWHHLKTSPSLTDAAMGRLAKGRKVLAEGGHEKVFQQTFGIFSWEKLLKAHACYLSTSTGPVIGTLYTSTSRVAFCSDNALCHCPAPGQQEWFYYKVVVPLDRLSSVNPSANGLNPSEKYIQIITVEGQEFWFMGFVSYDKALKTLTEVLQHCSAHSLSV